MHKLGDRNITSDNATTDVHSGCLLFPEHPNQCEAIVIVKRVVASISIIGCLFVIFVIWLYKKYLSFAQRLILFLTIAGLMHATGAMGNLQEDGALCNFEGWGITFTNWFLMLWICCITFNIFMNAVKLKRIDKYEWAYHLLSWGFSITISSIPLIGDNYEPAGTWCWLGKWEWRLGIWYIPKFVILFTLVFVFIYIIVHVHRRVQTWERTYDPDVERNKEILKEDVKLLRIYPLVYLLLSILPLVNRIQNAVDPGNPIFVLFLLHALTTPMQGGVNAVIFAMDKETMSRLSIHEIKVALQSRFSSPSRIQEYPTELVQRHNNPESEKRSNVYSTF